MNIIFILYIIAFTCYNFIITVNLYLKGGIMMNTHWFFLLLSILLLYTSSKLFSYFEAKIEESYSYKIDALVLGYLLTVVPSSLLGIYSLFSLLSLFFVNVII